jgi:hypothetical protein
LIIRAIRQTFVTKSVPRALCASIVLISSFYSGYVAASQVAANFFVAAMPIGVCISTSLSQVTNASVRVTCQGNQFVSIEPQPGKPFFGTHGGAHRFAFSQRTGVSSGQVDFGQSVTELEAALGQGTITALRVLNLTENDERLELLVSF